MDAFGQGPGFVPVRRLKSIANDTEGLDGVKDRNLSYITYDGLSWCARHGRDRVIAQRLGVYVDPPDYKLQANQGSAGA